MKGLLVIMALLLAHDVVCIVGKKGSGKSTRGKALVAEQLDAGARAIAFDPNDEWSRHGKKKKNVDLGPLRDRCTVDRLLAHPEWLDRADLSLAVVPDDWESSTQLADDLQALAEQVKLSGDVVFVLDEVGLYRDAAQETLKVIGTQSRHWGINGSPLVLIAQRMNLIEKSARDQCSMVITGVQTDPEDLDAIEKMVRPSLGDEGAEKFVHTVATLKRPGLVEWKEAA